MALRDATRQWGNLGALVQKSVPRILAYSSIAQAGYIMMGISLAPFSDQALAGSLFHIMNHAVMKSAAFIAVASVAVALAGYSLDKYRGLGKRSAFLAFAMAVFHRGSTSTELPAGAAELLGRTRCNRLLDFGLHHPLV